MEILLVIVGVLIVVAVLFGVVLSVSREGDGASVRAVADRLRAAVLAPRAGATDVPAARTLPDVRSVALGAVPVADEGRRVRDELQAVWQAHDAGLARLETRLGRDRADLEAVLTRELGELRRDLASDRDRLAAALARLPTARDRQPGDAAARERRVETVAELYARLARLEAAIAAATDPILLPGEPFAPPAELAPEALVWEHWKDVGERAFAFAEHFNAHRLRLDAPLAIEVAAFLARLRGVLTGEIYPNLRPDPSSEARLTLGTALDRLAAELPALRGTLEREYQSLVGATTGHTEGERGAGERDNARPPAMGARGWSPAPAPAVSSPQEGTR